MTAPSRQPLRMWLLLTVVATACSASPKIPVTPSPPPAPPPAQEVFHPTDGLPVWLESPMVKVQPDTALGLRRELSLFAARNEFVSFQVVFQGGQTGLKVASLSLPALEGPDRITGSDLLVYRETFLDIQQPSVQEAKPGRWPDGLVPDVDEFTGEKRAAFPFEVPPGEARALWVDVHVPPRAPPGVYQGLAHVVLADGTSADARINLTVVDSLMPSTPSLKTAFFIDPRQVCHAYVAQWDCSDDVLVRLLPLFHRLALEHRITLTGGLLNLPGHNSGEQQNWTNFESLWGPFLNGTVPSRLPGASITSWKYMGPASADALADFEQESQARGWLPRAFDYVGDEPPYWTTYEQVRERASLARQAAPKLRTLLVSNVDVLQGQQLSDVIDIIVVLINQMDRPPPESGDQWGRYSDFLSRPNRELWLYQSCESHGCVAGEPPPENRPGQGWPSYMIDRPATKARAMEWASFLEGATGELYYQTVSRLDTAWTAQFLFNGNGDGTLFYPGTPETIGGTTEVPVPSMRLKLIRMGFQDYEWLKAVSDAGDPDYARRVARRVLPSLWRVPDDGELFEDARLCLVHRYLELTGHTEQLDGDVSASQVPCPDDFLPPLGG